jgi:hypothetical protein
LKYLNNKGFKLEIFNTFVRMFGNNQLKIFKRILNKNLELFEYLKSNNVREEFLNFIINYPKLDYPF